MPTRRRSRRELLAITGLGGLTAGSASVLAACSAALGPPDPTAGPIMIIRHAEKPPDNGKPHGVDPDGAEDKHSLTVQGWTRAGALAQLFTADVGPGRPGLVRPTALFAAGSDGGEGLRTRQTVAPLAANLGLTVDTSFGKGDERALADRLLRQRGPTLVCWQHGELPAIPSAFGTVSPAPPASWPDERFDLVWMLTLAGGRWSFSQIPQLLLQGDRNRPAPSK